MTVITNTLDSDYSARPIPPSMMGPHLMMDCRGCDLDKIGDVGYIFNVLNELPEKIGMTKITQPYVFPYSGLVPEDEGVTGIVVIAESHLSFHSFTQKDYFFFDLFSCKPFEVEATRQYIINAFGVTDAEVHYVERGRDFRRDDRVLPFPLNDMSPPMHVSKTSKEEKVLVKQQA